MIKKSLDLALKRGKKFIDFMEAGSMLISSFGGPDEIAFWKDFFYVWDT